MKYITYLDYKKILQIAEKEQNNIPERYCRKREEILHNTIIHLINKATSRKPGKARFLLLKRVFNQGTPKWSHCIDKTSLVFVKNINETKCKINGHNKENVIAIVK